MRGRRAGNMLRRRLRKRAAQNGKPAKYDAFLHLQQIPRIIEHGTQTAMSFGQVLLSRPQKVGVALDARGNFGAGEIPRPCRRQFDAERRTIHELANPNRVRQIGGRKRKAPLGAPRARFKKIERIALQSRTVQPVFRIRRWQSEGRSGKIQAAHVEQPLGLQVQTSLRGDQNFHIGRVFQNLDEPFRALHQAFEIIEDDQHILFAQVIQELRFRIARVGHRHADLIGNRRAEKFRRGKRRKRDIAHAMQKIVDPARRNFEREARFAVAARADECEQPTCGLRKQRLKFGKFSGAPDERRPNSRQVVARECISEADTFGEQGGGGGRFHIQFGAQNAPARFVLRERMGALAGARKQSHHLAMRFLAPGIHFEQTPRRGDARRQLVVRGIVLRQPMERVNGDFAQVRALALQPFVEQGRAAKFETRQEIAAIQHDGAFQVGNSIRAARCGLPFGGANRVAKIVYIEVAIRMTFKMHIDSVGLEHNGAEHLVEVPQRKAQIIERALFGQVRPEQAGNLATWVNAGVEGKKHE